MQHLITRGLGIKQSIVARGFGRILSWIKNLISNAFIKKIIPVIIGPIRRGGYIQPTNGRRNK